MPRLVLLPILVLLLAAPAAAQARAPRAVVAACDRTHQSAVFEGRMATVAHADRMQMRFSLQVSTPDAPDWSRLSVPGFSSWVTSDPGRSRYVYSKRVEALLAPAGYRVKMRFRWLDGSGAVIKSARATSRACRQPDPRADLRVVGVSAVRGDERGTRRYDVVVRNAGRDDAPASSVTLELAGGVTLVGAVPPMAPGSREDVFLTGPRCVRGDTLAVTADADDAVDERDEAGNTVMLPCPSV